MKNMSNSTRRAIAKTPVILIGCEIITIGFLMALLFDPWWTGFIYASIGAASIAAKIIWAYKNYDIYPELQEARRKRKVPKHDQN